MFKVGKTYNITVLGVVKYPCIYCGKLGTGLHLFYIKFNKEKNEFDDRSFSEDDLNVNAIVTDDCEEDLGSREYVSILKDGLEVLRYYSRKHWVMLDYLNRKMLKENVELGYSENFDKLSFKRDLLKYSTRILRESKKLGIKTSKIYLMTAIDKD